MKKMIFAAMLMTGLLAGTYSSHAQLVDSGTVVSNDLTLTPINGQAFSLFSYLDQGYTVVIDLFATWCAPCWAFDQTGTFNALYQKYGPNGFIDPGKVMPISIEADAKTDDADLYGTGSNTQGDFVTGNPYPIVNLPATQIQAVMADFAKGGGLNFSVDVPAFLIICPNRTIVHSSTGLTSLTQDIVVAKMSKCPPAAPAGIQRPERAANDLELYPNPASGIFTIKTIEASSKHVQITDALGRVIYNTNMQGRTLRIDLSAEPKGLYFVHVLTQEGNMVKKIILTR